MPAPKDTADWENPPGQRAEVLRGDILHAVTRRLGGESPPAGYDLIVRRGQAEKPESMPHAA